MRYPSKNGLAIPVTELGFEVVERQRGVTTNHHNFWNRCRYQDRGVKQLFRGLVSNVFTLKNEDHELLHNRFTPPVIPRTELMIDVLDEYLALNGVINCVHEKKTNEVYQIESDQWQAIRGGYGKTIYRT
jgi:hypothetical protein